jgi:hypothetical protein
MQQAEQEGQGFVLHSPSCAFQQQAVFSRPAFPHGKLQRHAEILTVLAEYLHDTEILAVFAEYFGGRKRDDADGG